MGEESKGGGVKGWWGSSVGRGQGVVGVGVVGF